MIYIKIDDNGNIFYTHNYPLDPVRGLGETEEELKEKGILVEPIPEPVEIEGKQPILKWNGIELYYEYVDIPKTPEDILQEELKKIKQSMAELAELILGGM